MKEIEDLLCRWVDTELAEARAYRAVSTCAPTQNGEKEVALLEAREASRVARLALMEFVELGEERSLVWRLFMDYTDCKKRHGSQLSQGDVPVLFSQELAEIRQSYAEVFLALQEAYSKQFDETASARCATSSGPGSSPGG
jgi:hypothetical protein